MWIRNCALIALIDEYAKRKRQLNYPRNAWDPDAPGSNLISIIVLCP